MQLFNITLIKCIKMSSQKSPGRQTWLSIPLIPHMPGALLFRLQSIGAVSNTDWSKIFLDFTDDRWQDGCVTGLQKQTLILNHKLKYISHRDGGYGVGLWVINWDLQGFESQVKHKALGLPSCNWWALMQGPQHSLPQGCCIRGCPSALNPPFKGVICKENNSAVP